MMITYQTNLENVTPEKLQGFFVGWGKRPSPATHLRMLANSEAIVLAVDDTTEKVVGYINAISDGVISAFIPNLEVLPEYQGKGIGSELVKRMLQQLNQLYAVDLVCDPELQAFYERLGMRPSTGMILRNYERQDGENG